MSYFALYDELRRAEEGRADYVGGEENLAAQIGFVFTSMHTADDEHAFYGPLVHAARKRASAFGCDVVSIAPTADSWLEASSVERCVEHGAVGLVVFGGADGNPDVLSSRYPGLPAVFVEYDTIGKRSAHVGIDNEAAFGELVMHLSETGHGRIATITGALDTRVGAERLIGYRSRLERLGYTPRSDYIVSGDYLIESGRRGMQQLLALDSPPDAVACGCDVQAVGALLALEEAGLRCPEDVAVTGFDDAEFAASIGLTTVHQPARELGVAAIDSLVGLIREPESKAQTVLLPGDVVVRASCGAGLRV